MSSSTTTDQMVTRTKNTHLQTTLENWVNALSDIYERLTSDEIQAMSPANRQQAMWRVMDEFVRTFVPLDVTEEDIAHYRDSLLNDEEFFIALLRELAQCATGQRVESIQGDQMKKAIFTLLPPPELCKLFHKCFLVFVVSDVTFVHGICWYLC